MSLEGDAVLPHKGTRYIKKVLKTEEKHGKDIYKIFCFVDRASRYKFLLITNLTHFLMYLVISSLYMFRASQCSSSGDQIVLIHNLVWSVCVSDCLVCRSGGSCSSLLTKQSLTQTNHTRFFFIFIYIYFNTRHLTYNNTWSCNQQVILHSPNLLNIHNHELRTSSSGSTRSDYVPARHCPLLMGVTAPAALVGFRVLLRLGWWVWFTAPVNGLEIFKLVRRVSFFSTYASIHRCQATESLLRYYDGEVSLRVSLWIFYFCHYHVHTEIPMEVSIPDVPGCTNYISEHSIL